jgi:hypothetical protein
MKVVKYWRTEPVDKESDKYWSGYHESEEAAINHVITCMRYDLGDAFEVLPYYEIVYDWK